MNWRSFNLHLFVTFLSHWQAQPYWSSTSRKLPYLFSPVRTIPAYPKASVFLEYKNIQKSKYKGWSEMFPRIHTRFVFLKKRQSFHRQCTTPSTAPKRRFSSLTKTIRYRICFHDSSFPQIFISRFLSLHLPQHPIFYFPNALNLSITCVISRSGFFHEQNRQTENTWLKRRRYNIFVSYTYPLLR